MKGYRTLIIASLITIFGALQQAEVLNLVPYEYRGASIAIIGLIMAILRALTDTKPLNAQ
jgi:hypothetical protein